MSTFTGQENGTSDDRPRLERDLLAMVKPAGHTRTASPCMCGHPYAPYHQTPGAECYELECRCSTYRPDDRSESAAQCPISDEKDEP